MIQAVTCRRESVTVKDKKEWFHNGVELFGNKCNVSQSCSIDEQREEVGAKDINNRMALLFTI